jgi:hypothetical protein
MAKAIGEIVVKADHTCPPGAQCRVLVAHAENICGVPMRAALLARSGRACRNSCRFFYVCSRAGCDCSSEVRFRRS